MMSKAWTRKELPIHDAARKFLNIKYGFRIGNQCQEWADLNGKQGEALLKPEFAGRIGATGTHLKRSVPSCRIVPGTRITGRRRRKPRRFGGRRLPQWVDRNKKDDSRSTVGLPFIAMDRVEPNPILLDGPGQLIDIPVQGFTQARPTCDRSSFDRDAMDRDGLIRNYTCRERRDATYRSYHSSS